MKKRYSTKRAFVASLLALCMCFTMLVGTTFAWFTDSVTSSGNIIQSGTLKIDMLHKDGDKYVSLKDDPSHKVFDYANWEPGYTTVETLKIENKGSLALKYRLDAYINGGEILGENGENLADVIDVYMSFGASNATSYADLANGSWWPMGTLSEVMAQPEGITSGKILPVGEEYDGDLLGQDGVIEGSITASIALHMREEAGNEYQGLSLGNIYLTLMATQWTYEEDSFDDQYDAAAKYPIFESETVEVDRAQGNAYVEVYNQNDKVLTVNIPAQAIANDAENVTVIIEEQKNANSNITVESDRTATTYEVKVIGLAENNTSDLDVELYIGEGKTNVRLFHYDEPIVGSYNAGTGWLRFKTDSFSPYTVVYDVVPTDEPYVPGDLPRAEVKELDLEPIEWNIYEGLLPSDSTVQLEVIYQYTAPHNADTIPTDYKDWICDFVVMLDRDLTVDSSIVLGGYYEDWDWVGFDNGDIDLAAYEEVPLLGTFLGEGAGISYQDVVTGVEVFKCGVAHLDSSLDGATFTVKLRVTNPENAGEFYDVNVVTYKFGELGTPGNGEIVE